MLFFLEIIQFCILQVFFSNTLFQFYTDKNNSKHLDKNKSYYILHYFFQCFGSGFVSFWSAGSGSASMKRIRIQVTKNQPKSWKISTKINRISCIFFKTIKLMFTDINIYSINNKTDHISEKYIFFPILGRIWSRIRIHIKMKRIRNTDFLKTIRATWVKASIK